MEKTRMGFFEAIKTCLKKSFVFTGRARRSEFWWWTLFTSILGFGISLIIEEIPEDNLSLMLLFTLGILVLFVYLSIASFAVSTRRLHDIGRSGWWYGASLIFGVIWSIWLVVKIFSIASGMDLDRIDAESEAFILTALKDMTGLILAYILYICYYIVLIVWYCKDSQPGTNKYGENPKGITE